MARHAFPRTRISAHAPKGGGRKKGRGMEPQRRWAYCLLGVVAVLTTTLLIVARLSKGPELDPHTLCERGVQPPGHVIVLVGLYEPLTAAQAHATRGEILRRKEDLQVGERLSILALTPNNAGSATRPLFSKCRPRTDASWLFANPRMLQKRYHDDFEKPLAEAIEGLESLGRTDASLLLAGLREAVTQPSFRSAQQRGFVVISHHSPASFSMLPPEALPIADVRGALSGANVLLLQLMSEKTRHYQHAEHQQFCAADRCGFLSEMPLNRLNEIPPPLPRPLQ
ncbi:MAG: hypothetical protein HYZ81_25640 [Nitrospinae bacterium]|nr:hypothetical protein [Nitrospinota bacterium]